MTNIPKIVLVLTDGDANRLPSVAEVAQGYQTAELFGLTRRALEIFANEMVKRKGMVVEKGELGKHFFSYETPKNACCVEFC